MHEVNPVLVDRPLSLATLRSKKVSTTHRSTIKKPTSEITGSPSSRLEKAKNLLSIYGSKVASGRDLRVKPVLGYKWPLTI